MARSSIIAPRPNLLREARGWLFVLAFAGLGWLALTSPMPEHSWLDETPASLIATGALALAWLSPEIFRWNSDWAVLRARSEHRTQYFRSLSSRSGDLLFATGALAGATILGPRIQAAAESSAWLRVVALAIFIGLLLLCSLGSLRAALRASTVLSITDEGVTAEQLAAPVTWADVRHLGLGVGVSTQSVLIYLKSSEQPVRLDLGRVAVSPAQFKAQVARLRPEIRWKDSTEGAIAHRIPGLD